MMMEAMPATAYPELYRFVLIAGWGIGAAIMLRDWSDRGKRWLGIVFAVAALHYLCLAVWGVGDVGRFGLPAAAVALYAEAVGPRWLWWFTPSAAASGFLPITWVVALAVCVSALYMEARPLGRAVFLSGAPMLAMLLAELLPGFREWATGPAFPVLLWSMVTTQLYLPAWAIYRSGRAGEGHWLVCGN